MPAVYIMASGRNGTVYCGVSAHLAKRVYEHRTHAVKGFSAKYDCVSLVYYEVHPNMESAILREKQIKGGSRKKKLALIEGMNPDWKNLWESIL